MKLLLENWKRFLLNENLLAPYESDLEYTEDGKLVLYHVSSTSDIETLDPAVAAQSTKSYTKAEYRTWDRPRIFFFTRLGQEDIGVGRIQGQAYKATIDPNVLYPIMQDPLKLSYPDRQEEYKKIREERDGMPSYYPINTYDMVATLAENEGFQGFIYPQEVGNLIVALWNPIGVEKLEQDFY